MSRTAAEITHQSVTFDSGRKLIQQLPVERFVLQLLVDPADILVSQPIIANLGLLCCHLVHKISPEDRSRQECGHQGTNSTPRESTIGMAFSERSGYFDARGAAA